MTKKQLDDLTYSQKKRDAARLCECISCNQIFHEEELDSDDICRQCKKEEEL